MLWRTAARIGATVCDYLLCASIFGLNSCVRSSFPFSQDRNRLELELKTWECTYVHVAHTRKKKKKRSVCLLRTQPNQTACVVRSAHVSRAHSACRPSSRTKRLRRRLLRVPDVALALGPRDQGLEVRLGKLSQNLEVVLSQEHREDSLHLRDEAGWMEEGGDRSIQAKYHPHRCWGRGGGSLASKK